MEDQRPETKKHIVQVQKLIGGAGTKLMLRAYYHDQSKLETPEREIFDEFTPKLRGTTYGSDEYKGYLKDMKVALDHHYANNRHHPEHFKNAQNGGTWEPLRQMNLIDIVEMLCDWKAATMRHDDGDILNSIAFNQKRFGYSDELKAIFLNTVRDLDW